MTHEVDDGIFIAVIGGSDCSAQESALAEEVGLELARRGAILVCGGLGGVMEAACRGASAGGGLTIGILPGTDRRSANRYVRLPLATGLGEARNAIIVRSARAVIAIGGGYGTLSEIGFALSSGTPVLGLGTWELSRNGQPDSSIIPADSPADAVSKAIKLIV